MAGASLPCGSDPLKTSLKRSAPRCHCRRPPAPAAAAAATAAALPAVAAFALLAAARLLSAGLNIIHDCDETYNYLEPLHFLLHGSGLQTWEYGAQFALRSYLYLLLHAVAAAPSLLVGAPRGERRAADVCCHVGSGRAPARRGSGATRRPALPRM